MDKGLIMENGFIYKFDGWASALVSSPTRKDPEIHRHHRTDRQWMRDGMSDVPIVCFLPGTMRKDQVANQKWVKETFTHSSMSNPKGNPFLTLRRIRVIDVSRMAEKIPEAASLVKKPGKFFAVIDGRLIPVTRKPKPWTHKHQLRNGRWKVIAEGVESGDWSIPRKEVPWHSWVHSYDCPQEKLDALMQVLPGTFVTYDERGAFMGGISLAWPCKYPERKIAVRKLTNACKAVGLKIDDEVSDGALSHPPSYYPQPTLRQMISGGYWRSRSVRGNTTTYTF